MYAFWDANNPNSFAAYTTSHLVALALLAAVVVLLFVCRRQLRQSSAKRRTVSLIIVSILVLSEVTLNVWYVQQSMYSIRHSLPLELCSISLYLCVAMLLLRSRFLFQIVYFIGIGGALQALLTPVLGYAYPHYRFLEFFAAHIAIIAAVLYMVWAENMRPTFRSILFTMGFLNLLLLIVIPVNTYTGANYMFLARKPATSSLLDYLGPYPWYLLSMEAAAFVLFIFLYLPFAVSASGKQKKLSLP
ncbi:TIGR02206 family membrane protein [Paenibacillus lutrae]|uniref:TIGR02206 family membrane protein n=1 Tax=Paenibacillus lutrae TaxID=2078573 RepID=A0A7X3K0G1_9BACL|nr:TIGR02206 family membrane protein [Paenibacillus lutrae]MVP01133.1 TIGR02206 family membrane protein [Paenibacillus lutrae]